MGSLKNQQQQVKGQADVLQARLTRESNQTAWMLDQLVQRVSIQIATAAQPLELLVQMDEHGQMSKVLQRRKEHKTIPHSPDTYDSEEMLASVIAQLQAVPGIMSANHAHFRKAKVVILLRSGGSVRLWKNIAGVDHVFVANRAGECLYGGFVLWSHAKGLLNTLLTIQSKWEE